MKKGMLIYDSSTNRFDVLYEEGNSYGGLHCGTVMEVLINDVWISVLRTRKSMAVCTAELQWRS